VEIAALQLCEISKFESAFARLFFSTNKFFFSTSFLFSRRLFFRAIVRCPCPTYCKGGREVCIRTYRNHNRPAMLVPNSDDIFGFGFPPEQRHQQL
jgi:hypothetical protein